MGKGSMGTLLELGPEGDMGPGDMAVLCTVHPLENNGTGIKKDFVPAAHILVPLSSDVLVGSELPPVGPGQHTCL